MQQVIHWQETVKELGPPLLRYFAVGFSRPQAADLVQETLIRLVQKVESRAFDPEKGSLKAFAFGLAHWVRREAYRDFKKSDTRLETELETPAISETVVLHKQLRKAILALPEPQQEVLTLLLDQDLTLAEIGIIVGQPLGTIKSHVHRAKEALREVLVKENRL